MHRIALVCVALLTFSCAQSGSVEDEEEAETANVSTGSCGVERWAIKTGSDVDAPKVNMTALDTTITTLRGIAAPASLGSSSPRFTYAGSPEIQNYRLTNVTLTQYKLESDSDYHLVIQDSSGNTMIAELADPLCVTGGTWKTAITNARNAFDAKYTATTSFQTANVPVTITGVGFFDLLHGQTGVAPNGIEIHAVQSICFGTNCSSGGGGGGTALTNGGFESSLTGWTSTGTTAATTPAHSGSYAARVGSTAASTDSSVSQTFTLPSNATQVSFWYRVTCPDTVTYDWATATLKDNTTGTTTTVLAKTCANDGVWRQVTANVTAGHSVTLTLSNHDDNASGDPTYTMYDDVTVLTGSTDTTAPTTSITAPANGATVSGTVTVSTSSSDNVGVTKTEIYLDGALLATASSASWNTTSSANGSHTLTSKAYDAAGNVGTSAAVTVTVSNGTVSNPVTNPGFETGSLSGWTATGVAAAKAYPHSGSYAAALGSTSPSTDSSVAQTFTLPSGASTLSFWYKNGCPDSVSYDWATATLKDNVTGTTTTLLPHTCVNDNTWHQVSASVSGSAGHSVTLTLANHDDNYSGDATWTDYDDVSVQ